MRVITMAALLCLAASAPQAQEADAGAQAELTPVLKSESLVFNGIARTRDGRLFSPFQRQQKDKGIQLGEWIDGKPQAYPDAAWNAWKTGDDPGQAFVGANAIRIGPDGDLWVIDKGALFAATVPTGGTAIDADGNLYAFDTDNLRILKFSPDGTQSTLVQDPRLVWGDAMWIDEEGGLWIPAAQMNRSRAMNGGTNGIAFPTTVYRMAIGVRPVQN